MVSVTLCFCVLIFHNVGFTDVLLCKLDMRVDRSSTTQTGKILWDVHHCLIYDWLRYLFILFSNGPSAEDRWGSSNLRGSSNLYHHSKVWWKWEQWGALWSLPQALHICLSNFFHFTCTFICTWTCTCKSIITNQIQLVH